MVDKAEWELAERAREEGLGFVEEKRLRRELTLIPPARWTSPGVPYYEDLQTMLAMFRLLTAPEVGMPAVVHYH